MAPLAALADEPPKTIPYPQGKTFTYDGREKNALGKELTAVEGGFALLEGVAQVSLGGSHSAVITESGDLYTWGANAYGQLGDGTDTNRLKPVKILSGVSQVSLGGSHSAALTESGDLYTWGNNESGQVGNGMHDQYSSEEPGKILSGVTQVALGGDHSAAITESGDLYLWGDNYFGQLGDGTTEMRFEPVKVLSDVKQVALGFEHSAAVTFSGDLYLWGANDFGQIGNGTTNDQPKPVKVLSGVAQVSLGGSHSAAITESGDLYTWGLNVAGQLGDGTTGNRLEPAKVLSDVAQVSLGNNHSAVVTPLGNLYTWGLNALGQLGDGSSENRLEPVRVFADVTQVSLGGAHSAAVTVSGDVYTWGDNWAGQLGDGTTTRKNRPAKTTIDSVRYGMPIVKLYAQDLGDAIFATEAGNYHCYAVPCDGYCWEDGTREPVEVSWSIVKPPTWMRLGGKTRYDTMAAIVGQTFPSTSDHVVLVSGQNFPDALSAASLAGAYGCPVVTTKPNALSAQAKAEIERLGACSVVIVGGKSAVSGAVEKTVADLGCVESVERISGSSRYNTALEVMKKAASLRTVDTVFVATGKNFPDALAASPFSYANGAPIVLIDPAKGLTDTQVNAVAATGAKRAVLLGGKTVVPDSVATKLKAKGVGEVVRLAGSTRYTTAIEVAKWSMANGSSLQSPVVATGLKDADALVGATLAGSKGSALLLVDEKNDKGKPIAAPAVDFLAEHAAEVRAGYILGAEGAVSTDMENRILKATHGVLAAPDPPLSGQSATEDSSESRFAAAGAPAESFPTS